MAGTRRKPGQLGPQVEGYRAWLAYRGYTSQTVRNMLADLGQLGLWMSRAGLVTANLGEDAMVAFVAARQAAGHRRILGPRAMMPLLSYLREAGVTPEAKPPRTPLGALLGEYRIWLVQERGLAAATVLRYENTARRFLQQQAMADGVLKPAGLAGADVNAFLLRECGRVSAGSAKGRVAELRAVLRFLYLQGFTPLRLGTAVPPVGGWRLDALPPTMTAADVQLLLDSCDISALRHPRHRFDFRADTSWPVWALAGTWRADAARRIAWPRVVARNLCFTRVGGSQYSRCERSGRAPGPGLGREVRQSYGFQLACLGQPGIGFARVGGTTTVHLRGPAAKASTLSCPRDAEYFGADFRLGAYLPMFPPAGLANLRDAVLPMLPDGRILLDGRAWEMPTPQNLDVFIDRLERAGLLVFDPLVEELQHGGAVRTVPERTAQSRFVRAVGLSRRKLQVIERGRHAARLLRAGTAIADVVFGAGYYDQPHLTRSLRQLIGHTPAEVARGGVFLDL